MPTSSPEKVRDERTLTVPEKFDEFADRIGLVVNPDKGDGLCRVVVKKGEEPLLLPPEGVEKRWVEVHKGEQSRLLPPEGSGSVVTGFSGMIPPPYNMWTLIRIWETDTVLPQAAEAMARNVDGFGHRFEPILDFKAKDIDATVAEILKEESKEAEGKPENPQIPEEGVDPQAAAEVVEEVVEEVAEFTPPTEQEIAKRKEELEKEAKREHRQLKNFFDAAGVRISFRQLREETRKDLEITGNAYWEVLRNRGGDMVGFKRGEAETFRIGPMGPFVDTEIRRRTGILRLEDQPVKERFRKYALIDRRGMKVVFFKEFGDPRTLHCDTGNYERMEGDPPEDHTPGQVSTETEVPEDKIANEVIHFRLFAKGTPYGKPRWLGVLLAILGNRAADEVNLNQFDNKMIPPYLIMVSGGTVGEDSEDRVSRFIEEKMRGRQNYNRVLVLEATPDKDDMNADRRGQIRLHVEPLIRYERTDAQFLKYKAVNTRTIESSYRLPKLFFGLMEDFNRATAEAARLVAEQQVFAPEREAFDSKINFLIMPELDAQHWTYHSKGIPIKDPWDLAEMALKLVGKGLLMPQEARPLVEEAVQQNLDELPDGLGRIPLTILEKLTTAIGPDVLRIMGFEEKDLVAVGVIEDPKDVEAREAAEMDALRNPAPPTPGADAEMEEERAQQATAAKKGLGVPMPLGFLINGHFFSLPRKGDGPDVASAKVDVICRKLSHMAQIVRKIAGRAGAEVAPEDVTSAFVEE